MTKPFTPVPKDVPIAVNESWREYVYPHNTIYLENVTEITISSSGYHRVKADGMLVIAEKGWDAIKIGEKDWSF